MRIIRTPRQGFQLLGYPHKSFSISSTTLEPPFFDNHFIYAIHNGFDSSTVRGFKGFLIAGGIKVVERTWGNEGRLSISASADFEV